MTWYVAPAMQRKNFASAYGGRCRGRPRTVPALAFVDRFIWATFASQPWAANSSSHQARAKKPRSSPCGSISTWKAPATASSVNFMRSRPEEVVVDLVRTQQVLDLLD